MRYNIEKFHARQSTIEWFVEHEGAKSEDVLSRVKTHANVKFQGISGEWSIIPVGEKYFMVTCVLATK